MTQEERLYRQDGYALLWATIKRDELFQKVMQNLLIIEKGHWRTFLYHCDDELHQKYLLRRAWLFKNEILNEDELRMEVINRMAPKR